MAEAAGGVIVAADLKSGEGFVVVVQGRLVAGELSLRPLMLQEKGASAVSGLFESKGPVHGSCLAVAFEDGVDTL